MVTQCVSMKQSEGLRSLVFQMFQGSLKGLETPWLILDQTTEVLKGMKRSESSPVEHAQSRCHDDSGPSQAC